MAFTATVVGGGGKSVSGSQETTLANDVGGYMEQLTAGATFATAITVSGRFRVHAFLTNAASVTGTGDSAVYGGVLITFSSVSGTDPEDPNSEDGPVHAVVETGSNRVFKIPPEQTWTMKVQALGADITVAVMPE